MGLEKLVFGLVRALVSTEDYNLDMVLTDKDNVVVFERHAVLEGYRRTDVLYMIEEMKTIGDGEEK